MGKKTAVPDAWDDDWESQIDNTDRATDVVAVEEQVKISKAERLAKHAEANKQLWESAETPETFHFIAAHDTVPLKSEFKPTLKVLSRKPAPRVVNRQDPITGLSQMTIEGDEDDDQDLEMNQPTPEELRLRAQREREEKQRKYEEVRARLFGVSESGSGVSSPGNITPPNQIEDGKSSRGKGRAKGGNRQDGRRPESQSTNGELFDPNHTPKAGSIILSKRSTEGTTSRLTRMDETVIRSPRGPDGSGRGGFGFTGRNSKDD